MKQCDPQGCTLAIFRFLKKDMLGRSYCAVGWVDFCFFIFLTRVSLQFVVSLSKVRKMKKIVLIQ
jgi:hypothetical protein